MTAADKERRAGSESAATAVRAIRAWQANRLTTFTPSNILYAFGDIIIEALAAVQPASAEPESLVDRLRNPMWAHGNVPFESPQLDQEENLAAMREAADEIERLRLALPLTDPLSSGHGVGLERPLILALESIASWRKVNISGEYEHVLRDIIRCITDCAAAALQTSSPALQGSEEVLGNATLAVPISEAQRLSSESRFTTDEDRQYASELLADLANPDQSRLEIASQWFRKARVENSLARELGAPVEISAIHAALAAANLEYTGYSCNGVNLVGDRDSIKAVMSAFHSHSQIDQIKTHAHHWREECGKLHAKLRGAQNSSAEPVASDEANKLGFPNPPSSSGSAGE